MGPQLNGRQWTVGTSQDATEERAESTVVGALHSTIRTLRCSYFFLDLSNKPNRIKRSTTALVSNQNRLIQTIFFARCSQTSKLIELNGKTLSFFQRTGLYCKYGSVKCSIFRCCVDKTLATAIGSIVFVAQDLCSFYVAVVNFVKVGPGLQG